MKFPFEDKIMSSMIQKYAGSAIRSGLLVIATHYFAKGTVDENAITEISSALVVIGTAIWSLYQKHASQEVLVTALASSTPMSEQTAKAMVASPFVATPSVNTPASVVPTPVVK